MFRDPPILQNIWRMIKLCLLTLERNSVIGPHSHCMKAFWAAKTFCSCPRTICPRTLLSEGFQWALQGGATGFFARADFFSHGEHRCRRHRLFCNMGPLILRVNISSGNRGLACSWRSIIWRLSQISSHLLQHNPNLMPPFFCTLQEHYTIALNVHMIVMTVSLSS